MRNRYHSLCAWGGSLVLLATVAGTPARADEKADAFLAEVRSTTAATQTLTGSFSFSQQTAGSVTKYEGTFSLKRPNLAHIELAEPQGQTIVSDGKNIWVLIKGGVTEGGRSQPQYVKKPAEPNGLTIAVCAPITLFFRPEMLGMPTPTARNPKPAPMTTKMGNKEKIDGVEYQVVEVSQEKPVPTTIRLYISADKRLQRMLVDRKGTIPATMSYILKNVKAGGPVNDREFTFTPPKDAKQLAVPSPITPTTPSKDKPGQPGK